MFLCKILHTKQWGKLSDFIKKSFVYCAHSENIHLERVILHFKLDPILFLFSRFSIEVFGRSWIRLLQGCIWIQPFAEEDQGFFLDLIKPSLDFFRRFSRLWSFIVYLDTCREATVMEFMLNVEVGCLSRV